MITAIRTRFAVVRRDDDAGITLAELLITMFLSSLVLGLVATFFVQIARATTSANQSRQGSSIAANIANELSDTIRPATSLVVSGATKPDPAVVIGLPSKVTLYTFADNVATNVQPIRVQFEVTAANRLLESRWVATKNATTGLWVFPAMTATPSSTRLFPGTIIAASAATTPATSASAPLFSYYDSQSVEIIPAATGLTQSQRESVASIRFTVRTRSEASTTAAVVTIQNTVGLPNLGL